MLAKIITAILVSTALALSAPPVLAAGTNDGVIEGQLVNGTASGGSTAGQVVNLDMYVGSAAEPTTVSTKSDAQGRFTFKDLDRSAGSSYQVKVNFQEADYASDYLAFNEGSPTLSTNLTVYDSTTSMAAIDIALQHTVVYVGAGTLEFKEYILYTNKSDKTYIGNPGSYAGGKRETLSLVLPATAADIQLGGTLMQCCVFSSPNGLVDTMPLLPGEREIVYGYKVNTPAKEYVASRQIDVPILSYNFLVQGAGINVASDQLQPGEPLTIENAQFQHLAGANLGPGDTISVRIAGLPQRAQSSLIWVFLALGVLIVGSGLVYVRQRGEPAKAKISKVPAKERLLAELARLDDEYDAGRMPEDIYRERRKEKKAELMRLMQKSGGADG